MKNVKGTDECLRQQLIKTVNKKAGKPWLQDYVCTEQLNCSKYTHAFPCAKFKKKENEM